MRDKKAREGKNESKVNMPSTPKPSTSDPALNVPHVTNSPVDASERSSSKDPTDTQAADSFSVNSEAKIDPQNNQGMIYF